MPLPNPEPGLVISYSYLWRNQQEKGNAEGRKNRPCVIILAVENKAGETKVTVAPITSSALKNAADGVEVPLEVKKHLGLDSGNSWIIITEVNQFVWPGYDIRPIKANNDKFDYGFIPSKLFRKVKASLFEVAKMRKLKIVPRD
ncbi:MAG: type II toxin-antitoxin system PemK/MazF family toxin [Pseudomonadota bacterium]